MRLSFGLETKQYQKQVLAPRMIQSMEILQLPLMALQERIEQELSENPRAGNAGKRSRSARHLRERENPDAPSDTEKELVVDDKNANDDFERLLNMGDDIPENYEERRTRPSSSRIEEASDRKHDAMANAVARSESLYDHLDMQLGELDLDHKLRGSWPNVLSPVSIPMAM